MVVATLGYDVRGRVWCSVAGMASCRCHRILPVLSLGQDSEGCVCTCALHVVPCGTCRVEYMSQTYVGIEC